MLYLKGKCFVCGKPCSTYSCPQCTDDFYMAIGERLMEKIGKGIDYKQAVKETGEELGVNPLFILSKFPKTIRWKGESVCMVLPRGWRRIFMKNFNGMEVEMVGPREFVVRLL